LEQDINAPTVGHHRGFTAMTDLLPVLIVESNPHLGELWKRHIERLGRTVLLVATQQDAIATLQSHPVCIIVLNVVLPEGSAFAVADYASYRYPDTKVLFVTSARFFSDGSIFSLAANACAYLQTTAPVDDIAAVVEHYSND
jgi:DNA-binding response OmpR family regulator